MTREKEKVFYDNLYLVEMIKNTFRGHNLGMNTLDDLYQAGCIGLMNAVECGNSDAPHFNAWSLFWYHVLLLAITMLFQRYIYLPFTIDVIAHIFRGLKEAIREL